MLIKSFRVVLWTGCINTKTFTGSMDWMYQHENIYRLYRLDVRTRNRGPMDWMYQHENVCRLYGLDVSTRKRLQALWTGCINTKTFTGSMDWMYQHENI
jgi:hypothetical protein